MGLDYKLSELDQKLQLEMHRTPEQIRLQDEDEEVTPQVQASDNAFLLNTAPEQKQGGFESRRERNEVLAKSSGFKAAYLPKQDSPKVQFPIEEENADFDTPT